MQVTRVAPDWLMLSRMRAGPSPRVGRDHIAAVEAAAARLTALLAAMLPDSTLAPMVTALQTMRGMALVNAATLIGEPRDLALCQSAPTDVNQITSRFYYVVSLSHLDPAVKGYLRLLSDKFVIF
jgi:hypothetical protein